MHTKTIALDIDGVLFDIEKRLTEAFRLYCETIPATLTHLRTKQHAEESAVYWGLVFRPGLFDLDEIIPGSLEAVNQLSEGRNVLFQTSRPDDLLEVTEKQLITHGFLSGFLPMNVLHETFMMKPANMWVFTKTLKAIQIHDRVWRDSIRDLIIIDDQQKNLNEILEYLPSWCNARGYLSLFDGLKGEGYV